MSRRITAGNDAPFRWAVKLQGKPFDLSGKDVKVYVINSRGEIPVARLTIEGNEVSGVFEGRYQTRLGEHSLSLRINEGRPEMKTAAVANVFELVQWSADAGGSDEGDVIIAPIVVESEITAGILAEYTKKDEFDSAVQTLSDQLEQKVNKEEGKTLSTNDFTNALKAKLESLSNYDDQELREAINAIESTIDTLIGDNASKKIESFNEIIRFLEGVEDTESLEGIVAGIQQSIAKKADASVVVSLAEQVQTLQTEVESQNELIEDLQNTKIDKEADDYYPQLAVGLADNLSGVDVVDSEVNFRRSGGGAISDGVARIEAIKGNSVVWNQCFGNGATTKDYLKWEDNVATINGEFDADNQSFDTTGYGARFVVPIVGHKYLVEIDVISGTISGRLQNYLFCADKTINITESKLSAKEFITATTGGYWIARTMIANTIATNLKVRHRITDLTQMFGAGNEPTTIEEFYARIPMGVDLNSYNEGEVIHMDVQSIESQGVNAWDEEWEVGSIGDNNGNLISSSSTIRSKNYIKAIGGNEYYFGYFGNAVTWGRVHYYDAEKNRIGSIAKTVNASSFIPPLNCAYMKFRMGDGYGTTYKNDICINLSDTSINGKYFPYVKRTEDLSIIRKYSPDGMKSAGTAHDEIRYNKVTQKWEKVVRIGEIGFSEARAYNIENTFFLPIADMKVPTTNAERGTGLLCAKYPMHGGVDGYNVAGMSDKSMLRMNNGNIYIKDSAFGSDATAFKAAMDGVMLYYELAEPIVTELDEADQFKDLDYAVWNAGTEKAIAEGKSAPLAADITYGFNAIGKIKELESLVAALRAKVGI